LRIFSNGSGTVDFSTSNTRPVQREQYNIVVLCWMGRNKNSQWHNLKTKRNIPYKCNVGFQSKVNVGEWKVASTCSNEKREQPPCESIG